jgi:hypothetical protein
MPHFLPLVKILSQHVHFLVAFWQYIPIRAGDQTGLVLPFGNSCSDTTCSVPFEKGHLLAQADFYPA